MGDAASCQVVCVLVLLPFCCCDIGWLTSKRLGANKHGDVMARATALHSSCLHERYGTTAFIDRHQKCTWVVADSEIGFTLLF